MVPLKTPENPFKMDGKQGKYHEYYNLNAKSFVWGHLKKKNVLPKKNKHVLDILYGNGYTCY